ncbi:MAG: hypothetical protein HQL38_13230 [Alphaproteobacteria bacterium]|nr:hypothetical protein [Alphaproteobacteria bacterium]
MAGSSPAMTSGDRPRSRVDGRIKSGQSSAHRYDNIIYSARFGKEISIPVRNELSKENVLSFIKLISTASDQNLRFIFREDGDIIDGFKNKTHLSAHGNNLKIISAIQLGLNADSASVLHDASQENLKEVTENSSWFLDVAKKNSSCTLICVNRELDVRGRDTWLSLNWSNRLNQIFSCVTRHSMHIHRVHIIKSAHRYYHDKIAGRSLLRAITFQQRIGIKVSLAVEKVLSNGGINPYFSDGWIAPNSYIWLDSKPYYLMQAFSRSDAHSLVYKYTDFFQEAARGFIKGTSLIPYPIANDDFDNLLLELSESE